MSGSGETLAPGAVSEDGLWYWDGARWLSTTSPDGRWTWDGVAWRPWGLGRTRQVLTKTMPSPPTATSRTIVLASMLAGTGVAAIVGGVALNSALATGIADWQYLSVLAGVVLLAEVVTLGLLARPADWRRAFESGAGGWQLSIATSTLAFGGYAAIVWLLLIPGGMLTTPDFLTGSGRGWVRDALLGLLLLAGPVTTLAVVAATAYWRSVLAARVPIRSASTWILGIALLCGLGLLLVFSAAQGGEQAEVVLLGLLLPPLIGFVGLLAGREWGRSATTTACLCWASTGFGLVFSVPLLLLLWFRRPSRSSDPSALTAGVLQ